MTSEKIIQIAARITESRKQDMDAVVCYTQTRIATPTVYLELVKTDDEKDRARAIFVEVPYTLTLEELVNFLAQTPMQELTEECFYRTYEGYYGEEIKDAWLAEKIDVEYFVGEGEGISFVPVKAGEPFVEELLFPLENGGYGGIVLPTVYPQEEGLVPFGFPTTEPLRHGVQFLLNQGLLSAINYKLSSETN